MEGDLSASVEMTDEGRDDGRCVGGRIAAARLFLKEEVCND